MSTLTSYFYRQRSPFSLAILSLFLLAGCAQQPIITHQEDWKTHRNQLEQLTNYQARGIFGYISPQQRIALNFNWENQANSYQLTLTKMFKSVLKLDATPDSVTLIAPDGQTYQGKNAALLVKQLTGIDLPIDQMRYWLIGLPSGADTYQLNKRNEVEYLAKNIHGRLWEMHYSTYDDTRIPSLPTQMTLTQGPLKIKIKVSQWSS